MRSTKAPETSPSRLFPTWTRMKMWADQKIFNRNHLLWRDLLNMKWVCVTRPNAGLESMALIMATGSAVNNTRMISRTLKITRLSNATVYSSAHPLIKMDWWKHVRHQQDPAHHRYPDIVRLILRHFPINSQEKVGFYLIQLKQIFVCQWICTTETLLRHLMVVSLNLFFIQCEI